MTVEELPTPSSGAFLEVSFRRLLVSCEEIVRGDNKGRPDLNNWQRSPVFHHYVETLQEQLADLALSAKARIDQELLHKYRLRVDRIADQLERVDVPAFCLPPPQQPVAAATATAAAAGNALCARPAACEPTAAAATSLPDGRAGKQEREAGGGGSGTVTATRQAAMPGSTAAAAAAASEISGPPTVEPEPEPGRGSSTRGSAAAAAADARLRTQAHLQEDLTEELAGLAASLKSTTLVMESKLRERAQLLDSAEGALDVSLAGTKASAAKATEVHRRGRTNLCLTLLVMMLVGATFVGVYLFIRITRFAGYRTAPIPALPPPAPASLAAQDVDAEPLAYERHYDL